jgi:tetratricopeptide (TPR) repeat protein
LFAPHLGKNVIRLEANLPPESGTPSNDGADLPDPTGLADALTVENVFRRFDRRLAAGEALRRANKLLSEERWAEAEPELRAARKETPDDFDVLFVFGGLALHRGEFQNAYDMLSKAAGLQPDSTEVLQRLGAVLHAMGEREEAIECFQKILHLDPKNQDAHTDLAIVLWETNRRGEALAQLEQAKERWPNFNRAAELYDHFRKQERLSP